MSPFITLNWFIESINRMEFLNICICVQIAAGLPLDIMPGPDDPANFSLPQQVCLIS